MEKCIGLLDCILKHSQSWFPDHICRFVGYRLNGKGSINRIKSPRFSEMINEDGMKIS